MLVPHEDLIEQLERLEKEIKWIRISMWGGALLIVLYLPMLIMRLVGAEWALEDLFYAFLVATWVGILIVQYKILQQKKVRRERLLEDLREPEGVVVDQWAVKRMGGPDVIKVGTVFEINDRRARVVAIAATQRDFQNIPSVYTTFDRALPFMPPERRTLSYVLAKAKDDVPVNEVTRRIREATGLGAYTEAEFGRKTLLWVLENTGIGVNFGTTIALGFIVGMAIAGQTFYLFTVENLRQFGALKAMGASTFFLARMITLQAFTVGLIAYGIGVGLATTFGHFVGAEQRLPFVQTWPLLALVLLALVAICTFSAAISIIKLARLEPAIVFR